MGEIGWSDLLQIYLNTKWHENDSATIDVVDQHILDTLLTIDGSETEMDRAGISIPCEMESVHIGDTIKANIAYPKASIGLLVDDWNSFLQNGSVLLSEPKAYFIKEDSSYSTSVNSTHNQAGYRAALSLVKICANAAIVTDVTNRRVVFHNGNRVDLPLHLTSENIQGIDIESIEELNKCIDDTTHKDQKLQILSEAIIELISPVKINERLSYLVSNVKEIVKRVNGGYQIFVSSFSYNKIRNEVLIAQAEYVSKIHKTFTDIQGQVLGIPIAAFLVASQLKVVNECGSEFWINIAVLCGAWIFVILLGISCINQWITLDAISGDISRQSSNLETNFKEVSDQFNPAFTSINWRITFHRIVLLVVFGIGLAGAGVASMVFYQFLPNRGLSVCSKPINETASVIMFATSQ